MARTGRPKQALELSDSEREQLVRWERRRKSSSQALALRSRIVLKCATGLSNTEVAEAVGVTPSTVGKWRSRFCELRLDGLSDDPRPGRPATITTEQVEEVLVATLESTPENATHWTRSSMAKRSGLSKSTIGRIWRTFELKPHRTDTFKLSTDPKFAEKLKDVAGLYVDPPAHAVVLSVDEKSQIQALDRTQPGLPMKPGRAGTMTHDYKRHGTTTLFAALNILDGTVIGRNMQRHRHQEFIRFLNTIEEQVPVGKVIHAIVDNYATHKHPKVRQWLARHPRWTFHFTPTSASWLNAVEGFFAKLTRRRLKRGVFRSVVDLQVAINRFVAETNADPKPFVWTADPKRVLAAVKRGKQTLESVH